MLGEIFVTASLMTCNRQVVRKGWMIRKVKACLALSICAVVQSLQLLKWHVFTAMPLERKSVHNWLRRVFSSEVRACFQCIAPPGTMLITMSDMSTFFTASDTNCSYPIIQNRCTVTRSVLQWMFKMKFCFREHEKSHGSKLGANNMQWHFNTKIYWLNTSRCIQNR